MVTVPSNDHLEDVARSSNFRLLPQVLLIANKGRICSLGRFIMLGDHDLFIILSHTRLLFRMITSRAQKPWPGSDTFVLGSYFVPLCVKLC